MKRELPAYCYRQSNGLYFQRRGWPAQKVKSEFGTPDFWVEYALWQKGRTLAPKHGFRKLIDSYRRSQRFEKLAPRTKKDYDKVLDLLHQRWGEFDPTKVERHNFIKLRDDNASAPRFANYCIQVSRVLMEHAIDIGLIKQNPVKGVQLLKIDSDPRQPWPAHLIEKYRQAATGRELLVFELCLGTGQRIGDVLKMKWGDIENEGIRLRQNKTGKRLWVPLTKSLKAQLDTTERRSVFILTNHRATGPWSYRGASHAVRNVREGIGALDYDIHSLRYSTASELCTLGCDDETIAAITGQSLAMVRHYTAAVRQEVRALKVKEVRD